MKRILISAAIFLLVFVGLQSITKSNSDCVNLYIDYSVLNNQTKITKCIEASKDTTALDILRKANFKIEGTKKYGLSVVCRVNGLPNQMMESCETMPPENAYWALIVKEKQKVPFPTNEWGWGQLAVDQQLLNPGDSIGLVWANNGKVVFP